MRRPPLIAVTALGLLSVILIGVSLSLYLERPTVLRVAVTSGDSDDVDLVTAASKLAKHNRQGLRLKILPMDGVAQAAHALEQGDADLAVVRPDLAMPDKGETVVLLHKDVALLVAPGGAIGKITDLNGKRIGIVGRRLTDDSLLEAALGQYDIPAKQVTMIPILPEEVGAALKARTIDAVFVVGQVASPAMQTAVRAVAKAGKGAPTFLPIGEAEAMAERQPAYESVQVVKGSFGGFPPRPASDLDTFGVTTRLVASADLPDGTVAALTRFLLSERVALAQLAPVARRMTAPSTDRGAALPVHPGTAAYIDDEEETFLDRYSDFIYIGAMVLGVFASGLTAIVSRIGDAGGPPIEEIAGRLLAIVGRARGATSAATLDQHEEEVDTIVAEALDGRNLRRFDERKAAALGMAVDQARAAIRLRRDALHRAARPAANDEPALYEPVLMPRRTLGEV